MFTQFRLMWPFFCANKPKSKFNYCKDGKRPITDVLTIRKKRHQPLSSFYTAIA